MQQLQHSLKAEEEARHRKDVDIISQLHTLTTGHPPSVNAEYLDPKQLIVSVSDKLASLESELSSIRHTHHIVTNENMELQRSHQAKSFETDRIKFEKARSQHQTLK